MRQPHRSLRVTLLLVLVGCGAPPAPPATASRSRALTVGVEQVASGFAWPTNVVAAGDGSGRLFITLQKGRIVIFDGQQVLATPFLDLSSRVFPTPAGGDERGLLGLAFHPAFAENGYFYVDYSKNNGNADTVIARYQVSPDDPNVADPNSEVVLLTVPQPGYPNHKGGQLQFGPDGYLYIGLGDGGSAGDPGNRAQSLGVLLGKLLRIDVDGGTPYAVPPNNPFVDTEGALPEIWAYGLRNPWRFSFDRVSGDLLIGDVGQNKWEEVDYQPAASGGGENYGWRFMEGNHCYDPAQDCDDGTLTRPVAEYGHDVGCSITGGYLYRGDDESPLYGTYLYGDYCSGRIFGATPNGDGSWSSGLVLASGLSISTFGEDESGEIYFASYGASGSLYHVVP